MNLSNNMLFTWIIIPLLIFIARVIDVSIGTLRIIYMSRGKQILAPLLGFIEILIWLLAISQIFQNLTNVACYLAYASGFAAGNYVGIWIENKLALGMQVVRIITRMDATNLIKSLKHKGYGVTVVDGEGTSGFVKIIFSVIHRKDFSKVASMVKQYNPKAFFSVEDVRLASEGVFPRGGPGKSNFILNFLRHEKKGK